MKIVFRALFFAVIFFLINSNAQASETVGTINSSYKLTKICKNVSCSDYGNLNWKPTLNGNTTGATAVSVTDAGLTGFLWGDEIGWVNLSPTGAGVSINPSTGALSGTAYASVGGWINFNPTGAGVTMVDNGSGSNFYGYAYVSGVNGGWIKFDCTDSSMCIKTDWRTNTNRANAGNGSDSGSGRSGGGIAIFPINPSGNSAESSEGITNNQFEPPTSAYVNFPGDKNDLPEKIQDDIQNYIPEQNTIDELSNYSNRTSSTNAGSDQCKEKLSFVCIFKNLTILIGFFVILILGLGFRTFWLWKKNK